ncbi:MAG: recombinase RecT, partial [Pseudomonadota bacterium]
MTLEAETMPKKDFQAVSLQAVQSTGGVRLNLSNFAELEKFSHFMAISKFVPKHLREKQADCLAVLLQAMRWEMDPFTVAQKTYFVNELIGYEAQL